LLLKPGTNGWSGGIATAATWLIGPEIIYVIDFALMNEDEAKAFPIPFQLVADRVKPQRLANKRASYARFWWRFGEPRGEFRPALRDLDRYIVTVDTSRRRFFTFVEADTVVDDKLVCIASNEWWVLGVLSSAIHLTWATAAGGRLGVGNDPVYVKTLCFDPFPFPEPLPAFREEIGREVERIEVHRRAALERDEAVTMTGMYNVVEKLRTGEELTANERKIHEIAACGVLKDLHDALDALVARAYGWEWPLEKEVILERLVALHDERVKEEKTGKVRWLRPDYQIPRFGKDLPAPPELVLPEGAAAPAKKAKRPSWPADVISQIGAIKRLLSEEALTAEDITARFTGAKADLVRKHLEILLVMGEIQLNPDGRYQGAA
jgi:hypothetical protein